MSDPRSLRSALRSMLFGTAVVASTAASAYAAVQTRIAAISGNARVTIPHTIPARAFAGTDLGSAPANHRLDSMMVTFSKTEAQQAALTKLLIDLQDPSSPRYHQWLTPEEFGSQFGMSAQDLATVSNWLTAQGFKVTETARSSTYILFSGTVAQAQQAFNTSIHSVLVEGEQHISNLTDPALPAAIAGTVTAVSGLNDLKLKARARPRTVKVEPADTTGLRPQFTSNLTGNHYVAPGDFYTIYDVNPLLTSSCGANLCNGTGVGGGVGGGYSIAVVGQTNINLADVAAFRTASGLCTAVSTTCPNPGPTVVLTGNSPGTSSGDLAEAMLDVEWAGAVAPNAKIVYVNSTNVIAGSMLYAINNNLAAIISISYGDCEVNFGTANLTLLNQAFQQANAQGQTIVGPSGDSGATDCDNSSYPAVAGLNVDYPSSSPFVTSAGGSMFSEGSNSAAFWNTANGANNGSAISYIPEVVWNESTATAGLASAGGGASAFFTKPYWQIGTGVPADSSRDVPDISLNSASGHDGSLYCVSGSCANGGFRGSDGQSLSIVGGTSVASPSFAGVLALVEQRIGGRIGNAGPSLYALARSTSGSTIFHDIVSGNNNSVCTAGTKNCPSGGAIGYTATPGYDLATGLGSVDVFNLATKWSSVAPIGAGTAIGPNLSTTTLTNSSAVCGAAGSTLSLVIRVAGAASGAVNVPTGTIQILVDNVATGTAQSLSSGGVTYPLSTAGITSGGHTITAVYSGDATYASSKSFISIDVVSSSGADFAFTPCSGATTIRTGGTAPGVLFTVASVNGFTGPVTFSATSADSSLAANYNFSVSPLTVAAGSSGTTNFVLTAYVTSANPTNSLIKGNTAQESSRSAPWYAAGSGAALASMLLLVLPRRRRWNALLAVMLSIAAIGAVGCGAGAKPGTSTGTATSTITNTSPGSYNVRVTASGTSSTGAALVHSTNVAFTVTAQ